MHKITVYSKNNPMPRELFSRLFEIMEYSFPPNERRGFEEQFSEFQRNIFRSMVLENDGEITGFMNYWDLGAFVYLEHFAVARELRGRGIGTRLMGELRTLTENRPIILEAEPPEQSPEALRRTEFYKRLGFFLNPYEYYQPPYLDRKPVRLMIMSSPRGLTKEEFSQMKAILFRDAYQTNWDYSTQ